MTVAIRQQASVADMYLHQGDDVSFLARLWIDGRSVLDLETTAGETTVTSERAEFTSDDVGSLLVAAELPEGTTITAVASATEATISGEATATSRGAAAHIDTPVPLDLSDVDSALAQIRAKPAKTAPVIATIELIYNTDDLPGDQGYVQMDIAAADCANLPAGLGKKSYWDIQFTIDGKTRTYMRGAVYADAEVSQLVPA